MRVSKEYIASQAREKNSIKRIDFDANNVEANKVVESVKQFVASKAIQDAKAAQADNKMPKAFYDEITATSNFFIEKAIKGESTAELQDYLADIEKAVQAGEFVRQASTQKSKKVDDNDSKKKFEPIKNEKGFIVSNKPKNELQEAISNEFAEFFEAHIKGKKFSQEAINSFTNSRNYFMGQEKSQEEISKFFEETLARIEKGTFGVKKTANESDLEKRVAEIEKQLATLLGNKNTQKTSTKQDKTLDDTIKDSEVKAAWQEAKKAWIQEGKDGVLQHTKDDYTKLTELAQKSQNLQEFESGFAKLDAEVKADAQNPERAKVAARQTQMATEPKPEPQTDEPDTAAKKFEAQPDNTSAMDNLRAEAKEFQKAAPKNTQSQVAYSRQKLTQTA